MSVLIVVPDDIYSEDGIPADYAEEYIRSCKPVGVCKNCGGTLVRDLEGHIGCSNLACKNNIFQNNRRFDRFRRTISTHVGDGYRDIKRSASKTGRIHGGGLWRNLKGALNEVNLFHKYDNYWGGVNAREDEKILHSHKAMVKDDAVNNFRAGLSYREAVKKQITDYEARGWWKRDVNHIYIQKNEVKEIIWNVYKSPQEYGITWSDINRDEKLLKAYKSAIGTFGVKGALIDKFVSHGVESNKVNMGKISQLQARLRELDGEEREWKRSLDSAPTEEEVKKCEAEIEVIRAEIEETLRKIEDIEKHPELAKRMYVRGRGWIGNRMNGARARGGWFKRQKPISSVKGAMGDAITKYGHYKAKAASLIATALAFVVLFILYYMKVFAQSEYIPVSGWQIFVFVLLAIVLLLIKRSLAEDPAGRAEAREIIIILVAFAIILTSAMGTLWGSGFWTSLIFCFILGIYILFDFYTDSALVSIVLAVAMIVIIFFTASGWMDELGIQTEKVAVQTGFGDAIQTSMTAIGDGASDLYMMIINPNEWYAKKEMEQNAKKDPGKSERAVEITTAKVTPAIVNPEDVVNLLVEVENLAREDAKKPARDVRIYAKKTGKYKDHLVLEGGSEDMVERYIGDVLSGTGAQEVFEMTAPQCIATFNVEAGVSYEYDVASSGNVHVVSKERYDELVRQDKFEPVKQVTSSGAGPVSVSIKTNLPQPIPVFKGKEFTLYFGIINTRSSGGEVTVKDVDIEIPDVFSPKENGNCKLCKKQDGSYSLKDLYGLGDDAGIVCSEISSDNITVAGDITIFRCDMVYNGSVENVYFEKPFNIQSSVVYDYSYTKDVSFSVRKGALDNDGNDEEGVEIKKCT